jgi:cobalt transporter subunit CbtB
MTTAVTHSQQRADVRVVALVAFAFGVALVFMTGFAHSAMLHNAAHDTRHSLSFPCH